MTVRIGVDVGGTNAVGVALDEDGRIVASARRATRRGSEGVVATVRGLVADLAGGVPAAMTSAEAVAIGGAASTIGGASLVRTEQVPAMRVTSVGVGIPGIVAGGIVRHAVNLDVREMDLAAELRDALGVPVAVDNDVRAAALGAHATRGGSLAYLNLGTGVAAGIVIDGVVHRGSTGAAGEIGHISIDPAGPVCACGQQGCIEAFAGGAAIARRWAGAAGPGEVRAGEVPRAQADRDVPHAGEVSWTNAKPRASRAEHALATPPRAVFDAAAAGDVRAVRIRDDAVRAIAAAVRILVLAADVDTVVLGGGVALLGERLRTSVARDLDRAAAASPFIAELGIASRIAFAAEHAAPLGAALLMP